MENFRIKVSTDELKRSADEVNRQTRALQDSWMNLSRIIRNSRGYWQGDASDMHQKLKDEIEDDVMECLKRLSQNPKNLLQMAGIYEEGEAKAIDLSSSLPTDVI